jgi:hypothetical protein
MSSSFLRNVNIQANAAKTFVTTVTDPTTELPYDVDINTTAYGAKYAGGVYITNDGDLDCVMAGMDTPISFTKLKGGTILNIQIKKVLSTSDCVPVIGLF